MVRRDYTNAEGYICPTENAAVRNVDRGYTAAYTAPIRKLKTQTMRAKVPTPPQKPKDENLKRARQFFCVLTSIAGMMDFTIADITLKCKGDPSRYRTIGEKQTIERAEP